MTCESCQSYEGEVEIDGHWYCTECLVNPCEICRLNDETCRNCKHGTGENL